MSELVPVMLMVIVKVAVGVMDVIEMVVDEQAELGVYSTGLIILVSGLGCNTCSSGLLHAMVDVEADKEINLVAMEVCKVEKGMDEG